jgi:excisionase family DNA binding protein
VLGCMQSDTELSACSRNTLYPTAHWRFHRLRPQKCSALGKTKLYELIAANELASVKIGARRLIRVSAIEDFLNRLAAEGDG